MCANSNSPGNHSFLTVIFSSTCRKLILNKNETAGNLTGLQKRSQELVDGKFFHISNLFSSEANQSQPLKWTKETCIHHQRLGNQEPSCHSLSTIRLKISALFPALLIVLMMSSFFFQTQTVNFPMMEAYYYWRNKMPHIEIYSLNGEQLFLYTVLFHKII